MVLKEIKSRDNKNFATSCSNKVLPFFNNPLTFFISPSFLVTSMTYFVKMICQNFCNFCFTEISPNLNDDADAKSFPPLCRIFTWYVYDVCAILLNNYRDTGGDDRAIGQEYETFQRKIL